MTGEYQMILHLQTFCTNQQHYIEELERKRIYDLERLERLLCKLQRRLDYIEKRGELWKQM